MEIIKLTEEEILEKADRICSVLGRYEKPCVAFSGGADSTLLAFLAARNGPMAAITAFGPMVPEQELEEAREFTKSRNIPHVVFRADVMGLPGFAENGPDRCYHCKRLIFTAIREIAFQYGCDVIADGSNTDDLTDYRPGMKALREIGAVSPFVEAGISKDDIYAISEYYALPTSRKPAAACLASRIPTGERITPEKLKKAESGEKILKDFGFERVRLRLLHPEAVVELSPEEIPLFEEKRDEIVNALEDAGIRVSGTARAYRRGSMNLNGEAAGKQPETEGPTRNVPEQN